MTTLAPSKNKSFSLKNIFNRPAKPYVHPLPGWGTAGNGALPAFLITRNGLGASGGMNRLLPAVEDLIVPGHIDRTPYLLKLAGGSKNPLDDWSVPVVIGALLGGFISGLLNGRVKVEINKGPQYLQPHPPDPGFHGRGNHGLWGAHGAWLHLRAGAHRRRHPLCRLVGVDDVHLWRRLRPGLFPAQGLELRSSNMNIFPLQPFLDPLAENPWTYLVFGLIGFGFGFVLELSGFGNSKKLAAQFYFKDLTVLKVMFGAIVTAMVLIFFSSSIGILDYNLVYVPETYLWSGLLGGVIMGVGFIIGGFCPGTSVVSASTFKIDGLFFLLGAFFGVFVFGETERYFDAFWHSGYYGRLTLMDAFHLSTGVGAAGSLHGTVHVLGRREIGAYLR